MRPARTASKRFFSRKGLITTSFARITASEPTVRKTGKTPVSFVPASDEPPFFKKHVSSIVEKLLWAIIRMILSRLFSSTSAMLAKLRTMVPKQPFFGGEVTVIRPLALVPSANAERLCRRLGLPIIRNVCPSAAKNKRQEMRNFLESIFAKNPKVRGNIFHAMSHVNLEYLPPPLDGKRGQLTLMHSLKTTLDGPNPHESEENLISD